MGIKYQQNYQVPFYESDAFKKMRISSLLAVALQISGEQSTALGRSDVWVFERYGLFWAVIEYELTIHRLPEFNEKITIETEATSYNKFFCYRNFSFLDENGEVLDGPEGAKPSSEIIISLFLFFVKYSIDFFHKILLIHL